MAEKNRTYLAIDLKSFYASVECVERSLDALTTLLVVADASRTEKTICLAVSPALKAYGVSGRARLFEAVQKVKEANALRVTQAPQRRFTGESTNSTELADSPELAISYLVAVPRMALYMEYSTRIYNIYLRYVAPEDIHVYSIDEVFIDATEYLNTYHLNAQEMTMMLIQDVLKTTGITATAGIGSNLYLAKVAMDIQAKHIVPDKDGVRIATLSEMSYREFLWDHRPLTDFWRVGRGYSAKLEANGLFTMGDVARCSLGKPGERLNEDLLYSLFGINAELLIDHAWGWEPCTIAQIKAYTPESSSVSSGQVLPTPYTFDKAKLVVREMADSLVLDLVDKGLVTDQMVLTIGYDIENLTNPELRHSYHGEITTDYYGRKVPKQAHGSTNAPTQTSSAKILVNATLELFEKIVDKQLLIRRITIAACHLVSKDAVKKKEEYEQLDMLIDYEQKKEDSAKEEISLDREKRIQETLLSLKKKFGKNAVLKGMNLEEGATAASRNSQIGGHKA
jgi:DNA polymerase V